MTLLAVLNGTIAYLDDLIAERGPKAPRPSLAALRARIREAERAS